MRTRLPIWLAAAALLAACSTPLARPAPGGGPPEYLAPSGFVFTDMDALNIHHGLRGTVLPLGEPFSLPIGHSGYGITWRVAARDHERARIIYNQTLYPHVPGGLTLEAHMGGHVTYLHFAVQAKGMDNGLARTFATLPEASEPQFPVPLVVRDRDVWARFWPAWWQRLGGVTLVPPSPATTPIETPPPPVVASPGSALPPQVPHVAFQTRSVLFADVDVRSHFYARPVVTHIEGDVVHLAVPDGAYPPNPHLPSEPPTWRGVRPYAFELPKVPAGATLQLAPFPEAQSPSRLTSTLTTYEVPFPVPSAAFTRPPGLDDVRFAELNTGLFRVFWPADPETDLAPGARRGRIHSEVRVGDRPAWTATLSWQPATASDPVRAAEAAAREAGWLKSPAEPVYWQGHPGHVLRRQGALDGRPVTGAVYLVTYDDHHLTFELSTYGDVPKAEALAGIEKAVMANWRWR
jgi:hypothetical protein